MTDLSERARRLHDAVIRGAPSLDERLMILPVVARREGASEADVRMVRHVLMEGRVGTERECDG